MYYTLCPPRPTTLQRREAPRHPPFSEVFCLQSASHTMCTAPTKQTQSATGCACHQSIQKTYRALLVPPLVGAQRLPGIHCLPWTLGKLPDGHVGAGHELVGPNAVDSVLHHVDGAGQTLHTQLSGTLVDCWAIAWQTCSALRPVDAMLHHNAGKCALQAGSLRMFQGRT